VFRSLKNFEGQVVDDDAGKTLVGLSTLSPDLAGFEAESSNPRVGADCSRADGAEDQTASDPA